MCDTGKQDRIIGADLSSQREQKRRAEQDHGYGASASGQAQLQGINACQPPTVLRVMQDRQMSLSREMMRLQQKIDNLPPHLLDMPWHQYQDIYNI